MVTNPSIEPVTITALTDDVYGNLATQGTCTTAINTVLAANGGSYTCSFEGEFTGNAGDEEVDIVTVDVVDDEGSEATDDDDATVTITDADPSILVDKTATPESLPAPGGVFTFSVVVTNIGNEPLEITALTDDIYGDISTQGTCTTAVGTLLDPGEKHSCSFTGSFTGATGTQTDVVTVTATDDEDNQVTDTDDAKVTITPVAIVVGQNLNQPTTPTTPSTSTSTLPRTGARAADLVALAAGMLVAGGLLLLTGSRWAPAGPVGPLAASASGLLAGEGRRSWRRVTSRLRGA